MSFASRNSSFLLNTHYKKISSKNDDTMEEDYREFTEERILEVKILYGTYSCTTCNETRKEDM